MQTIIKLVPRIEITASGARRTVYRRTEIKPTDPTYQEELKKREEFYKQKDNGKLFNANQRTR